jgi:DUF3037 family protein
VSGPADTAARAADGREAFQYAILRVVPSLTRGEALNVGVVLHCRRARFLGVRTRLDRERLAALDPALDLDALAGHLAAIERIAAGDPAAGPLAALDRSDRFGWIVAPSSALVQPSPVHTGLCTDPAAMLDRLARELLDPPLAT